MKLPVTFDDYLFFAEAWMRLALARLILVFIPFKKMMPLLGKLAGENTGHSLDNAGGDIEKKISIAIRRGSRYSPWRTKCFEQALAAKMMLKRRGIVSIIYFGVCKNPDSKLLAHAWLKTGAGIVTGGKNLSMYTVLSSFIS